MQVEQHNDTLQNDIILSLLWKAISKILGLILLDLAMGIVSKIGRIFWNLESIFTFAIAKYPANPTPECRQVKLWNIYLNST